MPNSKSAKKRLRQNVRLNLTNKIKKSQMRSYIRKLREAVEAKDKETAQGLLAIAYRKIDKAMKGGCIHKNTAARRKAKISGWVNSLSA